MGVTLVGWAALLGASAWAAPDPTTAAAELRALVKALEAEPSDDARAQAVDDALQRLLRLTAGSQVSPVTAEAAEVGRRALHARLRPSALRPTDPHAQRLLGLPVADRVAWEAGVRAALLAAFDIDRSGLIDLPAELSRVSCEVWRALDDRVQAADPSADLKVSYLAPRSVWGAAALGLGRGLALEAAAEACGPSSTDLSGEIRALPGGGSTAWDAEVRARMLTAYDLDHSGLIDAATEVKAVPCDVWQALDQSVRSRWVRGLSVTYGLDGGLMYLGGLLGFGEGVQPAVKAAVDGCIAAPAARVAPAAAPASDLAAAVRAVPEGGSDGWDAAVRGLLLAELDADGDDRIGTVAELAGVTCPVWSAIDAGVQAGWNKGVYQVYGFGPDLVWVGGALGIAEFLRPFAADALMDCGLADARPSGTQDHPSVVRSLRVIEAPGTLAWTRSAAELLAGHYDLDRDGRVASAAEVSALPCVVWSALDAGLRRGGSDGLGRASPDAIEALGLPGVEIRPAVALCGLSPDARLRADARSSLIGGLLDPGTAPWDDEVRGLMLAGYDLDASGKLDRPAELRAIDCQVWAAIDTGVRARYPEGLLGTYGFLPGARRWLGYALGVDVGLRALVADQVGACPLNVATAPSARKRPAYQSIGDRLRAITHARGTAAWDHEVRDILIDLYDVDRSGFLDQRPEVVAAPCDAWWVIDGMVRAAWSRGVPWVYGTSGDTPWRGDALGIDPGQRRTWGRRLVQCDIER